MRAQVASSGYEADVCRAGAAAQLKRKQQSQQALKGFQHVLRASATTTAPVFEKQELEMAAPQAIYRKVSDDACFLIARTQPLCRSSLLQFLGNMQRDVSQ